MFNNEEMNKIVARFIGVSMDKLPINEELLIDAIVAEGIRLSLFQSVDNRANIVPIYITQVKKWAARKTRSLLDYFGADTNSKINDVFDSENRPNMVFLGDIVKLPKGYVIPAMSKYVSIDSEHFLLISGFPTFSLTDIGIPIYLNGISRTINSKAIDGGQYSDIFELERNNYLDKSDFEKDPKQLLEFLISNYDREKWMPNKYENGYLGNVGSYGFSFGSNPIKVSVGEGTLTFWRITLDYHSIYRFKLETKNSNEFSITIPNFFFKRICLAMDSLFNNKRRADLSKTQHEIKLELNFSPPAAEMRLIYALGGTLEKSSRGKHLWIFPSIFLDEVRTFLKDLWINIGGE